MYPASNMKQTSTFKNVHHHLEITEHLQVSYIQDIIQLLKRYILALEMVFFYIFFHNYVVSQSGSGVGKGGAGVRTHLPTFSWFRFYKKHST